MWWHFIPYWLKPMEVKPMINAEGLELIKKAEGFRSKPYKCPAGVWTIRVDTYTESDILQPNGGVMDKVNIAIKDEEKRNSLVKRMAIHVNRKGEADCWLWEAKAKTSTGYGNISAGRDLYGLKAHRVAWALANGAIPCGLYVCHKCDNPLCCNPAHLFLGTAKDNTRDMIRKGRHSKPPVAYGESHHNTKCSVIDIMDIKKDKRPARLIANDYGLSTKTVYRIRQGNTWKALDKL